MLIEPAEAIRVLLVDDDEEDYLITADLLARQTRVQFAVEWEPDHGRVLLAIREQRHDVYLIDYRLGSRNGLELVGEAFAALPWHP